MAAPYPFRQFLKSQNTLKLEILTCKVFQGPSLKPALTRDRKTGFRGLLESRFYAGCAVLAALGVFTIGCALTLYLQNTEVSQADKLLSRMYDSRSCYELIRERISFIRIPVMESFGYRKRALLGAFTIG
jgi:hypothetical protein